MKTLIISSSLSAESKSYLLCKAVEERLLKEGVSVDFFDAKTIELIPHYREASEGMRKLSELAKNCDNIVFGLGIHNYSISDSLKIILDNCLSENSSRFFGMVCSAGGPSSYLATQQLMQTCMNQWRMIPLPRVVYATGKDFVDDQIQSEKIIERLDLFTKEFIDIGNRLI